jgi:hypothetical protein
MYELNDRTPEKQPYPLKEPTRSRRKTIQVQKKNHPDPEKLSKSKRRTIQIQRTANIPKSNNKNL